MKRGGNRRSVLRLALLVTAVTTLGSGAPVMAGVEGPCTAFINGVEAGRIDTLDSPLELQATDVITFHGTDETGTQSVKVEVILATVSVRSGSTTYGPLQQEFSASLDLDEVSPYGVGLFRVRGTTDNCTAEAWVRVSGRFPFTTLIGLTAGALALAGLAAQLMAIASRRRWSPWVAAIAGLVTGAGAAGVAQQFGTLQLSIPSIAIIASGAALLGALIAALLIPRDGPGWIERRRTAAAQKRAIHYQARLEAARLDARRREAEIAALRAAQEAAAAQAGTTVEEPAASDGTGTSGAAEASEPSAIEGPYWCYVMAPVDVFDLADHDRVVGLLQPGKWYLAKRQVGGWVQVALGDGHEGWTARSAVHKHG